MCNIFLTYERESHKPFSPHGRPDAGGARRARQPASSAHRRCAQRRGPQLRQPARARGRHQPAAAASASAKARRRRARDPQARSVERRQGAQLFRSRRLQLRVEPDHHRRGGQIPHPVTEIPLAKEAAMADHASAFLLVTMLVLITVVLLFGMKYFSASRQAMFRVAGDDSLRQLAEKSALAQAASAASLTEVQSDVAEVKTRLAAIEKLLREVE